jgi:predicted tellurium resistance membrane protein TerC
MRTKSTVITDLPSSPDQDRHARMIRYSVAMGIRMVCLVLCVVIPDWWRVIPAVGAIVLPYFAVVIANNASRRFMGSVQRPGTVVPVNRAATASGEDAA